MVVAVSCVVVPLLSVVVATSPNVDDAEDRVDELMLLRISSVDDEIVLSTMSSGILNTVLEEDSSETTSTLEEACSCGATASTSSAKALWKRYEIISFLIRGSTDVGSVEAGAGGATGSGVGTEGATSEGGSGITTVSVCWTGEELLSKKY